MLYIWRSEFTSCEEASFSGNGNPKLTDEQKEIAPLQKELAEMKMEIRKEDCCDNAVADSFFKTLKTEWIYEHKYATKKQAKLSVFEYIETWHNTQRSHKYIQWEPVITL